MKGNSTMTRKQRLIVAAATILVAPLLGAGAAAAASPARPAQLGTLSAVANSAVQAKTAVNANFVAAANIGNQAKTARLQAAHAQAFPNRGEGIISIVTRICGSSRTWQANAAANGIVITSNPPWLVMYGKALTIDCAAQVVAAATTSDPAPEPPAQPPAAPAASAVWFHPLPGHCRNHGGGGDFGAPRPLGATGSAIRYRHQGIDFGASTGTPIHAIGGGNIFYAGYSGNAGYQIQERIGNVVVKYNHLSKFARTGGFAYPNEVIGYVGETGDAVGAHLHMEIWVNGNLVNPADYMWSVGVGGFYC